MSSNADNTVKWPKTTKTKATGGPPSFPSLNEAYKQTNATGAPVSSTATTTSTSEPAQQVMEARKGALAKTSNKQIVVVESGSSETKQIKEMVLWSNDVFIAKVKEFSQTVAAEFDGIVVERPPNGIEPVRRLQWLLERHPYHAKFFMKVHLTRGSSWYQYCSGTGNGVLRNKDLYVKAANALTIGKSKDSKAAGQVSPLTLASVLAPIMSMVRQGLDAYCRFPNVTTTDLYPVRFQFAGSLSAWILGGIATEAEHALTAGRVVILYGMFLQSYIDSANFAKAKESTATQVVSFWTKLITGCHLSLFLWSADTKASFLAGEIKMPKAGPRIVGMGAWDVKKCVDSIVGGDPDAAEAIISAHCVREIAKIPNENEKI